MLLHIFSVLGDLTTNITSKGWKVHRLIGHVEPVSVELVFLQVTFSDTFITNITEDILGGGGGLPHLIIVFEQGGVIIRMFSSVMRHLLFLRALGELVTVLTGMKFSPSRSWSCLKCI